MLYNGSNLDDEVYYDDNGDLVEGRLDRSNDSFYFDVDGNIMQIVSSSSSAANPYIVPDASWVYYDAQGNVRKARFGDKYYYYKENGEPENDNSNSPVLDMTPYKLTTAQMAEVAGSNANTATAYASYTKCQEFPGSYGCSNP